MKNVLRWTIQMVGYLTIFTLVVMVLRSGAPGKLLPVEDQALLHTLWEEGQMQETLWRAHGPLEADDPELLRLLRERYLDPPSPGPPDLMLDRTGPEAERYNVYRTGFQSWVRINQMLEKLFSEAPPGIFLEAGALDGEFISNSLYLEKDLGWTGLLIEADPNLYIALPGKKRKAWSSQTCISPTSYAQRLTFEGYYADKSASVDYRLLVQSTGNLAGVMAPAGGQMGTQVQEVVQCFPLFSYLLALNITTLQYVSLDVEGAEADILLTLPWEQLNVTVWSIEHRAQNTRFKDFYQKHTQTPIITLQKDFRGSPKEAQGEATALPPHPVIEVQKRVVYVTQHDPAGGKDDYFVRFMNERGYILHDYWDGDYTFINKNSNVCKKNCRTI